MLHIHRIACRGRCRTVQSNRIKIFHCKVHFLRLRFRCVRLSLFLYCLVVSFVFSSLLFNEILLRFSFEPARCYCCCYCFFFVHSLVHKTNIYREIDRVYRNALCATNLLCKFIISILLKFSLLCFLRIVFFLLHLFNCNRHIVRNKCGSLKSVAGSVWMGFFSLQFHQIGLKLLTAMLWMHRAYRMPSIWMDVWKERKERGREKIRRRQFICRANCVWRTRKCNCVKYKM